MQQNDSGVAAAWEYKEVEDADAMDYHASDPDVAYFAGKRMNCAGKCGGKTEMRQKSSNHAYVEIKGKMPVTT